MLVLVEPVTVTTVVVVPGLVSSVLLVVSVPPVVVSVGKSIVLSIATGSVSLSLSQALSMSV